MILADQMGLFSRVITDFNKHLVVDKLGKEIVDVLIDSITIFEKDPGHVVIQTLGKHDFEDGDKICIDGVVGLE